MGTFEFQGWRVHFIRSGNGPYAITAWLHHGYEPGAGKRVDILGNFLSAESGYAAGREYVISKISSGDV